MTRGKAAVTGVLALAALCACGPGEQTGEASGMTTSAPTSTKAPTTTGTSAMPTTPTTPTTPPEDLTVPTTPPEDLTMPPTRAGKHTTVRVRGTVSDGVEPGCRLLTSKGVTYLLIWRHGTLVTGKEIEVEGTVQPDLVTTCQQGTPLVVGRVLSP